MYDITIVSGSNSKYFKHLIKLIKNIESIKKRSPNLRINIVIYDLGLNSEEVTAIKERNVTYEKFNFDLYPEHVSLAKYSYGSGLDSNKNNKHKLCCSYAWKPIIIHEVCLKYGGIVFWSDSRNIHKGFKDLIITIKNNYIYSPSSHYNIEKLCHKDTIKLLNAEKYRKKSDRSAGNFGVNYNIQWCRDLVNEWKTLSLIKECIIPDGSNRSNHRQDQSILSILFWKYNDKYKFPVENKFIRFSSWNN